MKRMICDRLTQKQLNFIKNWSEAQTDEIKWIGEIESYLKLAKPRKTTSKTG